MIVSASRRSDLPALYMPWLMNRLREGYVLVPRPHQPGVVERVNLRPNVVDALVFFSKNPAPLLECLPELEERGYFYCCQFTINGYDKRLEPHLPPLAERIRTFCRLGERMGRWRLDWRYDPIILADGINIAWHLQCFAALCAQLAGYTDRCIISFVDDYPHLSGVVRPIAEADMLRLAGGIAEICARYDLAVYSCAEAVDLSGVGVASGACIDGERLSTFRGYEVAAGKDAHQRRECRCAPSIDIGSYDTCTHGCRYCYATTSTALATRRSRQHDPRSPLLWGWPNGGERIVERESGEEKQLRLF